MRHHEFGVAPAGFDTHDPIADGPAGDPVAHRFHEACIFEAQNVVRALHRVGVPTEALHDVGPITCRLGDPHPDLVRARNWVGNVHDLEDLGPSGCGDDGGAHAGSVAARAHR